MNMNKIKAKIRQVQARKSKIELKLRDTKQDNLGLMNAMNSILSTRITVLDQSI
jgi:hypothetical protein